MCTQGDTLTSARKLFNVGNGYIVGFTGGLGAGLAMKHWWGEGANIETFPESQKGEQWSQFVVASPVGVFYYETTPHEIEIVDQFYAFGSGRETALGVLAMGGNAIQAVEIASQYVSGCGKGCDWFEVQRAKAKRRASRGKNNIGKNNDMEDTQ
jgi:hypothetical protein